MTSFKDAHGNEYTIDVTIGAFKRVKDTLKIDLYEIEAGEPPLATRLQTDIELLVNVIYCICKPQADKHGDDVAFGESLNGEAFFEARNAFLEALIDFFQKCQRQDRATALAKAKLVLDEAVKRGEKRVRAIDVTALMDAAETAMLSEPSGASPESSAATPGPLHFVSSASCPKDANENAGSIRVA